MLTDNRQVTADYLQHLSELQTNEETQLVYAVSETKNNQIKGYKTR